MIIVLKDADFSATHLKKVKLNRVFSAITNSIFERYGIVPDGMNDVQIAFDDFVLALYDAGLWGTKIKSLCLPFLSEIGSKNGLMYAGQNVINGANFFTKDIEGSLALEAHGLKPVIGSGVAVVNLLDYVTTRDNLHLAGYNTTEEPVEYSSDEIIINKWIYGYTTSILGVTKHQSGDNMPKPSIFATVGHRVYGDTKYASVPAFHIASVDTFMYLDINGQRQKGKLEFYSEEGLTNPPFSTYRPSLYESSETSDTLHAASRAAYGVLSLGLSLTENEAVIYNNAVNNLMKVVMAM